GAGTEGADVLGHLLEGGGGDGRSRIEVGLDLRQKVSRKKAAEIDSRTREKILAGRVGPAGVHDAPRHRAASSAERTRGTPLAPGDNEVLRLSDEVLRLSDEALRLRSSE